MKTSCSYLTVLLFSLALVLGLAAPAAVAQPERLVVGDFSSGQLVGWEEESFEGETEYLIRESDTGVDVLMASSRASASGLAKEKRIDLWQTPILNWRWKIENRLPPRNETKKSGDDYPVRIYLIIDGGFQFWKSKALNYVWTRGITQGSTWHNAYAGDNVVMLSMRDAEDDTGTWYTEKRNVLKDLQEYIDPEIRYIDGIAIMTDTDDTDSFVNSYYGDIYFTKE